MFEQCSANGYSFAASARVANEKVGSIKICVTGVDGGIGSAWAPSQVAGGNAVPVCVRANVCQLHNFRCG